jgi:hypothetical protein
MWYSSQDGFPFIFLVKSTDGDMLNIPESVIGQLRFKQTSQAEYKKDKWETILRRVPHKVDTTDSLRPIKNRNNEFEDILKRDK